MPFDLSAYLARIGLAVPPAADAAGLALVQRAHRLAIAFETLDIALGRRIAIDGEAVFAKLVAGRRGGCCFEHNQLFIDALGALGFEAAPLLARVWLGASHVPVRTHALALVTIDGTRWIADAGFGGSYAPPMPLADGEAAEAPDGARFRLARDPLHGWMLERARGEGEAWEPQYSFTEEHVFPVDLELASHWIQTAPESRFARGDVVSIPLPHGLATLEGTRYRRRNGEQTAEAEIADASVYRMRLSLMFGIDLSAEEVAALGLF